MGFWICYSYRIIPNSFFLKETFPIGFNDFSEIKGQFVQFLEFSWKRCLLSLKKGNCGNRKEIKWKLLYKSGFQHLSVSEKKRVSYMNWLVFQIKIVSQGYLYKKG